MIYIVADRLNLAHVAVVAALVPSACRVHWTHTLQLPPSPLQLQGSVVMLLQPSPAWEALALGLLGSGNRVWRFQGTMRMLPKMCEAGDDVLHCLLFALGVPGLTTLNAQFKRYVLTQLTTAPNFKSEALFMVLHDKCKSQNEIGVMQAMWRMDTAELDKMENQADCMIMHERLAVCYEATPTFLHTKYGAMLAVVSTNYVDVHHRVMCIKASKYTVPIVATLVLLPEVLEDGWTGVDWMAYDATNPQVVRWRKNMEEPDGVMCGTFLVKQPHGKWIGDVLMPSLLDRFISLFDSTSR